VRRNWFRPLAINLFRRFNPGNITIRHQYTGDRILLHSFQHRAYWYKGKSRERSTMELFARLIAPGDFVIDIGGHIGYITLYLASLVGERGKVVVFEPGPNNLPYIRANVQGHATIDLVEKAASDLVGPALFYIENLTGQNNSLLSHYAVFEANARFSGISGDTMTVEVDCTTVDDFLETERLPIPSLIKIDVEGAELAVLTGMTVLLRKPGVALMVEVTEQKQSVFDFLTDRGYVLFNERKCRLSEASSLAFNVFCLRQDDPRIGVLES